MTTAEALDKIGKALGVLAAQTHAENLAGMFSRNRLAEDLLLPVFQIIYHAPQLRNLNSSAEGSPYIDLADDKLRLAIQITTERTSRKVTHTLKGFLEERYDRHFNRLIFFFLNGEKPHFNSNTQRCWRKMCGRKLRFNVKTDIIAISNLYSLVAALKHSEIFKVQDIIAQTVIGEAYIDIGRLLAAQAVRQLEYETKTFKYIPDIFIETRETKNLARTFAHPVLFFRRTLQLLQQLPIPFWNDLLKKSGLPPLPFPDVTKYHDSHTLDDIDTAASQIRNELAPLVKVLAKYKRRDERASLPVQEDRKYYYEQSQYKMELGLGIGLDYELKSRLDELALAQARIFILTGSAGQGKTNLVCDFVANFLLRHKIPCAYLTGRFLRLTTSSDLGDAVQRILFEGKTNSFVDAAERISQYSYRTNKPFLLIIDGLNEHHRICEFAEQLQFLIQRASSFPYLRFFLTCRSEFFQERFGVLTKDPLKSHVFVLNANEYRIDDESRNEMVANYFKYFEIQSELVSDQARDLLMKDMLLLRFFCEAYGARGKSSPYRQPYIASIYRDEIFQIYLKRKLDAANVFLEHVSGKVKPVDPQSDLRTVLELCLGRMVESWQFADIPISAIPSELNEALYVLLDEELILRKDIVSSAPIFGPPQETINFTFDEFRDFLLAQYLVNKVYARSAAEFESYIVRNDPKQSQVVEGLKRFLFYASRHEENSQFLNSYKHQNWYKDVYDYEIFNIEGKFLRDEDRAIVAEALKQGDERAKSFAPQLSVRWHTVQCPILNLDLLVSVIREGNDDLFASLIMGTFKTYAYRTGYSARSFCKFIDEKILPLGEPDPDGPTNALFQFLILLTPVDSTVDLDSEAYRTFHRLLSLYPLYAEHLLSESFRHKPTRHRPYVWRLLSSNHNKLPQHDPLLTMAQQELTQTQDVVLTREVARFLSRRDPNAVPPTP